DHHIVCLAGDGCMQEGVAMEAVEFAGHQQLDNLILIYDANAVTLDAMAKETQSEDTAKRFEAIGFDVQTIEGHDMELFRAAFEKELDTDYEGWTSTFDAWKKANPKLAEELASSRAYTQTLPKDTSNKTPDTATLLAAIPPFADAAIATRKAGQDVLQPLAAK